MQINWKDPDYDAIVRERMARLKGIRDDPKLQENLASLKAFYKDNPAAFISDWGCTFDPRNLDIGKPTVIPFVLFPKQVEYIGWVLERWRAREDGVVEKSRDMGVTWLCVGFAVWLWTFYPGSVSGFGSRIEDYVDKIGDPKSIFWKVRFFVEMLPDEFKPAGYRPSVHAPHMRVVNPETGAAMVGEGGDNIGRGNRTSIFFVDEAAHIEHQEQVDAALSGTSNCKIWVSTPCGAGNVFYRKRHGGKIKYFIFDWKDDPRKGPEWYEKQEREMDPVVLAQEVNRDYEGSMSNAWIPGELVTKAQMRGPADVQPIGGLRVGVDVARFGDDKTVISFRRGRVLLKQITRQKLDTTQVAGLVKYEIDAYKESPEQIAVDVIGIGAGVADILRALYPDVQLPGNKVRKIVADVNAALVLSDGQNFNMRAYMARQVKEWLPTASMPNEPDLKTACTCFKYKFKGGALLIESKEEVKKRLGRSPDEYDSLALTFAIPVIVEEPPPAVEPYQPAVAGTGM